MVRMLLGTTPPSKNTKPTTRKRATKPARKR
jgi:hypothetical protein